MSDARFTVSLLALLAVESGILWFAARTGKPQSSAEPHIPRRNPYRAHLRRRSWAAAVASFALWLALVWLVF
jgi:hypothetical protein